MAYYLSEVDSRFLGVLEKLQLYQSNALEIIWREKSCTVYEICFYIACINPKAYGEYFAISKVLPTPYIVKNISFLLKEAYERLRPKLLKKMMDKIRVHFELIYTLVQDGVYLFTSSTPFLENDTFYLKDGVVKRKPTRKLVREICSSVCGEKEGKCVDKCTVSLLRHFEIEIALQTPRVTKRSMFPVNYKGYDVEIK